MRKFTLINKQRHTVQHSEVRVNPVASKSPVSLGVVVHASNHSMQEDQQLVACVPTTDTSRFYLSKEHQINHL